MKVRWAFFAVSAAFFILLTIGISKAVDTAEIDRVRKKEVLDDKDRQIIDRFIAETVEELLATKDFTSVSDIRIAMTSRSKSTMDSAQAQYVAQFRESAYKHISEGFKRVGGLTPDDRNFKVILNLLILVDSLEDVGLMDLALERMKSENTVIRYWAVHCVTNPAIIRQLNSGGTGDLQLAKRLTTELSGLVGQACPEEIALIAEFGGQVAIAEGEGLLTQIVDMRIKQYAEWNVDYELLDTTVLKLLYDKISSGSSNKAGWGQLFGQLYSYAIQRYIEGKDILSDTQKGYLASLLVEIESSCVGAALSNPQGRIRTAIEQDDYQGLKEEHDRLLGSEGGAGLLAVKMGFDYGKNPEGKTQTAPPVLPKPPKRLTTSASVRTSIED